MEPGTGKENDQISYKGIIAAILRAKDPSIEPLKDRDVVEPLGQMTQLMAHDNYDRDNRLGGRPGNTMEVHGWKKIDSLQRDNGATDSLSMSLWQKGDAVVATVLSVASPTEVVRNIAGNLSGSKPESYAQAQMQIAEWKKSHPGLVLMGHGDKGSTIVLQEAKNQNLPAFCMAPDPGALKLNGKEAIVCLDMSTKPVAENQTHHVKNGLVTRVIDGTDVAGTGRQVASNFIDRIDMRGYNAAFGIARLEANPSDPERVRDVTTAVQPVGVRFFNNPLRAMEQIFSSEPPIDYRLKNLDQAIDQAEKASVNPPAVMTPEPSSLPKSKGLGLDGTPNIRQNFTAQADPSSQQEEIPMAQPDMNQNQKNINIGMGSGPK